MYQVIMSHLLPFSTCLPVPDTLVYFFLGVAGVLIRTDTLTILVSVVHIKCLIKIWALLIH